MLHRASWTVVESGRALVLKPGGHERLAAAAGMMALCVAAFVWSLDDTIAPAPTTDAPFEEAAVAGPGVAALGEAQDKSTAVQNGPSRDGSPLAAAREIMAGGYLGVSHTHPSAVAIRNPGRTDMTVRDVQWEGKPFKSPIYYGLRALQWPAGGRVGTMIDFTHAKAIARFDDVGTFTGTHEGKPLPPKAKVGDVFKHLEFSHGHNMLTLNGMTRLGSFAVQPYVGAGAGISLPHTEIGFRTENGRTYEYQYAGLVGQALAGLEVRLGRASVFIEYKLSYAPYDVPLSGVVNGWLLVTDVWRQLKASLTGEPPSGGRLTTQLVSHHVIGGVLTRVPVRTARPRG